MPGSVLEHVGAVHHAAFTLPLLAVDLLFLVGSCVGSLTGSCLSIEGMAGATPLNTGRTPPCPAEIQYLLTVPSVFDSHKFVPSETTPKAPGPVV